MKERPQTADGRPPEMKVMPFNPLAPEVLADPYPHYRRLRSHDPVHWGVSGDPNFAGCWYITRYDDVVSILKDQRFGREIWRVLPELFPPAPAAQQPIAEMSWYWMVLRDPPAHTRLRSLVHRVFTPRMIERLTPRIAQIVDRLLDDVQDKGGMDIKADFAFLLPVIVIAEMLGVPPEDCNLFIPWSKALAAVIEFKQSDEVQTQGSQAILALNDYLRSIIAERRKRPREDLISALLAVEEEGQKPTEAELLGTCTQLLFGGNEPVADLIGNGLLALLRHPDQLDKLRNNPELAETAVDELARYDSSVQMTFRYVLGEVTFGGKTMRQGEPVAIVFGAANRDPAQFPNPDQLDLARTPNRLASYGFGIHYCLGAAMARAEGRIAFNILLRRFPNLTLQTDTLTWNETVAVRGLKTLPVSF